MADIPDCKALKRNAKTPDGNDEEIDRLSALPDEILCHVLSFLYSTEDAALTSVLSTRWRNLFVQLPDVYLSINTARPFMGEDADPDLMFPDFLNFGFRLILRRNGAPLRKFRLFVRPCGDNYRLGIHSLISAALLCKVKELDICLMEDETSRLSPPLMFTCKTLVSLKLWKAVDLIIPDLVSLPNLKVMHLIGFKMVDEGSIQRFIDCCPLLEELILNFDHLSNMDGVLDISSLLLRKLELGCLEGEFSVVLKLTHLEYLEFVDYGNHKVYLDTPNVKYFKYTGYASDISFVRNMSSLVRATIGLEFNPEEITESSLLVRSQRGFELIKGLQSVKSLHLYGQSLQMVYYCQQSLPTFSKLKSLELDTSIDGDFDHVLFWKVVPSLLEIAPNLEVLIFPFVYRYELYVEEFSCFWPKTIPASFIQHLKEIEIERFRGQEDQFKLVEHLLENGKSLKKMTVGVVIKPWLSWSEECNRILSFRKCSKDCQVVFVRTYDWD
ncbi:F-box protein At4g22280-like [Coffea eugenioides]|uniref:F-box protein At4g22280-like n=1 Tax=Coffea eugenioides TaxID=49369 RepID=UPI000F609AB4|nr:F-box protein At4g22280-like [Coffea eugenioides]